jgi:hypothetical protein
LGSKEFESLKVEDVLRLTESFSEESACEYNETKASPDILNRPESLISILEANRFRYFGKAPGTPFKVL